MDRPEKTVISRRPDGNARRKKQRASRDAAHRKIGMMPGSLVYVGEPRDEAATISVIDFDATTLESRRAEKPDDVFTYRDSSTNSWIRVVGLHDVRAVEQLGAHFRIHPLTLEDIVNTNVRPRYEDTGEYVSVIVKALEYNPDSRALTIRQIAVVWGRNWVISFEEGTGSIFGAVQERIEKTVPRQRMIHPDYLAYALIDLVVDQYFLAFEHLGDQIEEIEDSLVQNDQQDRLGDILALKRVLTSIRRAVWPVRETVSMLERSDSSLILKETHLYIRDLYEHSLQVLDTVETSREMTSGLLDIYLTSVSNRMNSVMKVLTIIATIFIPLSFLAGVYGMNFDTSLGPLNMPELGLPFGYLLFWAMAIAIGGGLLIWFRRKRWL